MNRQHTVAHIGSRGIPNARGGVERVLEAVAPRLVGLGYQVTVYCAQWAKDGQDSYRGVRLLRAPSIHSKHLDTTLRSTSATIRELGRGSSIVHYHAIGSAPFAFLARARGKRVVVTVHGLDWQRRKWGRVARWMLKMAEWSAVRAPHETVVVGPELKRSLDDRYRTSVTYIPNGVETRSYAAPCRIESLALGHRNFVLFLARLVPEKQAHVLIDAFRLSNRTDGVKLVIAGATWHSQSYTAELHRLAGDDPDIIFTGEVDEETLEELYSNCAIYVLPSEVEGMSLALLDALSFGCCVVCSDVTANTEVVGDAGLVFAVGDALSLAGSLSRLLDDPALAQQLRDAAAARAQALFSWDGVAEQWAEVYDRVLATPVRPMVRIPRRRNGAVGSRRRLGTLTDGVSRSR